MRRLRVLGILTLTVIAAAFVVLLATTSMLSSFGGTPAGDRLARMERSPTFREGKFHNTVPTAKLVGSFWDTLEDDLFGDEPREPAGEVPVMMRTAADYETPPRSGLRATWIGHGTVLLEIGKRRVLFDPVFSERCSPSTIAGPKRFHPPPMTLESLPPIDAVVISHDHYDHLDMITAQFLAPRGTKFVVPLGIGAHLEAFEVPPSQIVELDWHESTSLLDLELRSVPSRHYSGRFISQDPTLWSSWVATSSSTRVFFSGDTGYFEEFRRTGEKYGPFDLTILKIGAYGRTWPEIHMTPEEAVQAHLDLRGKVMLPMHWGTFNLAPHAYREPAERVLSAARAGSITIVMPKIGELVEPSNPPAVMEWWSSL
jgi:L-ascorbate metabolism protein UlaG (beta-lactamase superfamily)